MWFQFQTGAIKSFPATCAPSTSEPFQFQTGAIKRPVICRDNLEPFRFQFQTGAIKSNDEAVEYVAMIASFNSKLVRLKDRP